MKSSNGVAHPPMKFINGNFLRGGLSEEVKNSGVPIKHSQVRGKILREGQRQESSS
jgi:hypothetical protein